MYFEDLTPYRYIGRAEPDTLNVGWLDADHAFRKGRMPKELLDRLFKLCLNPLNRTRGYQACPFCNADVPIRIDVAGRQIAVGDAEIRVEAKNGRRYAAPTLISHYVQKHGYSPPNEFQQALWEERKVEHEVKRSSG